MRYYKPLSIILLALISSSIFAQDVDIDSLVRTHKRIAILPVRVIYILDNMNPSEASLSKVEEKKKKEYEDGFILQEKLFQKLIKLNFPLKVTVQSPDETNNSLADNEIIISDLSGLSTEFLCEILKVDAVVVTEIRLSKFLSVLSSGTASLLFGASRMMAIP